MILLGAKGIVTEINPKRKFAQVHVSGSQCKYLDAPYDTISWVSNNWFKKESKNVES